jgi:hypothetical protein
MPWDETAEQKMLRERAEVLGEAARTGDEKQVQELAAGADGSEALYEALRWLLYAEEAAAEAKARSTFSWQGKAAKVDGGASKAAVQLLVAVGAATPDKPGMLRPFRGTQKQ